MAVRGRWVARPTSPAAAPEVRVPVTGDDRRGFCLELAVRVVRRLRDRDGPGPPESAWA
jgi:hypothetical protein